MRIDRSIFKQMARHRKYSLVQLNEIKGGWVVLGGSQTNTASDVTAESGNFPITSQKTLLLTERSKAEASLHSQTNLVGVYCRGPLLINLQATVHYF